MMLIELSLSDLKEILRGLDECESKNAKLEDMIVMAIAEAEELESIDMNDCGDSCKL